MLLLLNGLMRESANELEAEFAPLLGLGAIHRFFPPAICATGRDPHHPARLLAEQVRTFLIGQVSRTGGHLGPNLGVVELTLAIHRVFDSPRDTVIFDTGHQSYVHKVLTGRQNFSHLRQAGGLSANGGHWTSHARRRRCPSPRPRPAPGAGAGGQGLPAAGRARPPRGGGHR